MATTLTKEPESNIAVVEPAPAKAAAANVAAVPETPAELLKQWAGADQPNPVRVLLAAVARCWANLGGPGMTAQARRHRDIAEARGFTNGYIKLP